MNELLNKIIEPKNQIREEQKIFSNRALKVMLIPLFMEQLLGVLVGVADTFMVSYAGEAAVSGVSLVNMFNTVFLFLFSALAAGGSVVVSQYIGSREKEKSSLSAGQLVMISVLFSLVLMAVILLLNRRLLGLLFGEVEADVMEACVTYLRISAYSYPAIAVYNAGAAIYRSMGKTNVTMYLSLAANGINVVGNAIGVFLLHAGVAGVAYPSLISRSFSGAVIIILCFKKSNEVYLVWRKILCWKGNMIRKILGIAVPNGIENGLFQMIKVALSSITALFGTVQIAANGVAQSFWSVAALMGTALGLAFITEGAIPFAASDPLHVLPSCIIGSAVSGALSMAFGCTLMAPHGGIFVFPVVEHPLMYLVSLVVGTVIGALLLGVLKKKVEA